MDTYQRATHQGSDVIRLSLAERIRPRSCAIATRRHLTRTRHRTVNIHPINAAGLAVLLMRDPTLATDIRSSVLAIPRLFAPRAVLNPSPV